MGNVYMEAEQVRFKDSTYRDVQAALAAALEGGGGGGTTVVANPEGEATADLAKLQVGDNIYGIPAEAGDISYDNTASGLTADDVQAAIDEMVSNFGDGVDEVYNACVAAGSTPTSKSPADIAAAIGSIGGNITKIYTHTGDATNLSLSEDITISADGYIVVVGYAYVNDASVKVNTGSEILTSPTTYYFFAGASAISAVNANDVVHYVASGTGNCSDQIDIYLLTNMS